MLKDHLCLNGETCLIEEKASLSVFSLLGGYFWMVIFHFLMSLLSGHTHIHEANISITSTNSLSPNLWKLLDVAMMIADREGHSIAHKTQASSHQLL